MPAKIPRACIVCGKAGCTEHTGHRAAGKRLYNDRRWRHESKQWLDDHPECAACGRVVYRGPDKGHPRKGHVDHITPHKGNRWLFWDSTNWQTLCATCHGAKDE